MIKYMPPKQVYSIEESFIHQLTMNKWLASPSSELPDADLLFSNHNDKNRFYFQDDPFGDHEGIDLIDLHPTADAEIENQVSTLIVSCFGQHNYMSLSVESKEFFLKSFEIRIYYDSSQQFQKALSLLIEHQDVLNTENYNGFLARLLDDELKVFWQSGLVLGQEVTFSNLLKGHPVMTMNW